MKTRSRKGFTLVEMAIVLVIIGIILAGVMKGRDIVRGAQVKQFSQGFAQKWVTVASTYFDKVGQHFADGAANGGFLANPNGLMDNVLLMASNEALRQNSLQQLRDVGITPCTLIKSDLSNLADAAPVCNNGYNIWSRTVEGEFSGRQQVFVGFASIQVGGATGPIRNVVFHENVPIDVAIGLDNLIDGQADGENGNCLLLETLDPNQAAGQSALAQAGTEQVIVNPIPYPSLVGGTEQDVGVIALVLDY